MNMRSKLTLWYGILLTGTMVSGLIIGIALGQARGQERADSFYAVLAGMVWLLVMTGAYLIALWLSGRLELLLAQEMQTASSPGPERVAVSGNDEITQLATLHNKLLTNLTQEQDMRNRLVTSVAHELRTPLTLIRGHLESVLDGTTPLSPENLLPILDETSRMAKLVQDLQQVALAQAGRLSLEHRWFALESLLSEIVKVLEIEAQAKGIRLDFQSGFKGEAYFNRAKIKQALINLIGNAVRYTQNGGAVFVRLEEFRGTTKIEIRDNGPGISPEHLPYLFLRFYRVEDSGNRSSGGTGLGLAIAKEFIEIHGGSVAVKSEPGEGTVFSVTLPALPGG